METRSLGRRPLLGRGCRRAPLWPPTSGAYRHPPALLSTGRGSPARSRRSLRMRRCHRRAGSGQPAPAACPAAHIRAPATRGHPPCEVTEAALTRRRSDAKDTSRGGAPFALSTALFMEINKLNLNLHLYVK